VLDLGATFVLVVRPYSLTLDCGRSAVFSRSTFGHDAVFTTHLIRVGHQARISNSWVGTWALAKIDKMFWSWPLPRIVLLIAPEGGLIGPGLLSGWEPANRRCDSISADCRDSGLQSNAATAGCWARAAASQIRVPWKRGSHYGPGR
jgi:hypothetical protein